MEREAPVAFPDIVLLSQQTLSSCFCFTSSFSFKPFYSESTMNETELSELVFTISNQYFLSGATVQTKS